MEIRLHNFQKKHQRCLTFFRQIVKMSISIDFKRYSKNACVPLRETSDSAGYNLYAAEDKISKSCGREFVRLDLQIAIPDGYHSRIVRRLGLVLKCGLLVHNSTIDSDYCGIVCVILFNFSDVDCKIEKYDPIAQLFIECYYEPEFVEVLELSDQRC